MSGHSHPKCRNEYTGALAKDERVKYSSFFGGVFPILVEYVLNRKGVVYGAGYNDQMEVIHQEADDLEQLERIKKMKYVQSNMHRIFLSVEPASEGWPSGTILWYALPG